MTKLIVLWILVSMAETGILCWINKKESEFMLNTKKYGALLVIGNCLLMIFSWYKESQSGVMAGWYFGIFTYLFCLAIYDLKFKELPDWWHLVLIFYYAGIWLCGKHPVSIYESGFVTIVFAAVLGIIFLLKREAIGIGDMKLLLLCSAYAGSVCIGIVVRGMILAFFYSIILVLLKKVTAKSELPFVPFLFLGALFI